MEKNNEVREDKEKMREELQTDIEEFLSKGGSIDSIPSGIIRDPKRPGKDRFINHGDSMKSDKTQPGPRQP